VSVGIENVDTDGSSLLSWRDGPARRQIVEFVRSVSGEDGSRPVPVEERVAVFDDDGTLWCEKPMPIQLDFILRRLIEDGRKQELRDRQPWKAACERDYGRFGALMVEHYAGDDNNVKILAGGTPAAYEGSRSRTSTPRPMLFCARLGIRPLGRGALWLL
jgi:hypothetical protein